MMETPENEFIFIKSWRCDNMKKTLIIALLGISLFVTALTPEIGTGKIIASASGGSAYYLQTTTGFYKIDGNYHNDQTILFYTNDRYYMNFFVGL